MEKIIKSPLDELLTVEEAGKFLKCTKATIFSKVHRKKLPYIKHGKRVYFSKDELTRWLIDQMEHVPAI